MEILYQHGSQREKRLFSLIVLSKDDPRLFTCLRSIQEAEHADRIELVVALDASPAAYTQQVLCALGNMRMAVVVGRTTHLETISSMRNRGASLASCEMLVYIDSDCTLAPNFVAEAAPLIEAGHPLMTGQVFFKARPRSSWFSRKNSQVRQNEYTYLFRGYVRSPNLLIHRDILSAVGGFEPHVPYGDDFLLNQKCRLAGYRPLYCETLVMEHHDDESAGKTIRTCFGYGIGNAYRYKREQRIVGSTPLPISFATHMPNASWDLTLFCWFRSAVINLGFVYGLHYWRETDIVPLPFALASGTGCEAHRYQR